MTHGNYYSEYSGSVVIPSAVTYSGKTYKVTCIGKEAFLYCRNLTFVVIPNSVTTIEEYAFSYCTGLTSITIGSGVTSLASNAFIWSEAYGIEEVLPNLTSVHITDVAAWCKISFPSSRNNPLYYAQHLYMNGQEIKDLVIPEGVISIGKYAFSGCGCLTSVTIPSSVTSIGNYAFYDCYFVKDSFINNSGLTGDFGCTLCDEETNDGLLIKNNIIVKCRPWVTTFTIPESVTGIDNRAFDRTLWYNNQPDGLIYADKYVYTYKGTMPEGTEIVIKEGTIGIARRAFSSRRDLTSVTFPNSVTSIGEYAFQSCSGLISVTIGNGVTSIGFQAFYRCSSLTSITIPNSVTSIGNGAFYGCSGLTSVTIPNSVTSIGSYTFYNCSALPSITIPDSVTSIGNGAFSGCIGLISIAIPNGVTSIGNYAFDGCTSLTSITIPNSVTSIGSSAFAGCRGLKEIYCYAEETPEVYSSSCFSSVDVSNVLLVVPDDAVEKYKAHEVWGQFMIETATGISLTPDPTPVGEESWYGLNGRKLDKPQRGINIIHRSDGTTRKVIKR